MSISSRFPTSRAARSKVCSREVVLDIAELQLIDSSGINAIPRLTQTAVRIRHRVALLSHNVLRVLDFLNVEGGRGIRVERRPSGGRS